MQAFLIPDDFRAFMRTVVGYLDTPGAAKVLDGEDAFKHECGYGGRIDGADTYRFKYLTANGHHRWDVLLREAQIRDISDGLLIEVDAERFELVRTKRRTPVGDPLLVWGEYADDALSVSIDHELLAALDTLHRSAHARPRMLRLWTAADDQLVAALWGDQCALYIVDSAEGYATSMGNQGRTGSFEVKDHEGQVLTVPWADCVSWDYARRALVRFVEHSDLGDIPVEGRIPTSLLMMGDIDRTAALAARVRTPRELSRSSLPRMIPPAPSEDTTEEEAITVEVEVERPLGPLQLAAWARRLLEVLQMRELIELSPAPAPSIEEISDQLGGLLQAHARQAENSLETADWLANEIGAVRGVKQLFATGGDLQVALRRSREP